MATITQIIPTIKAEQFKDQMALIGTDVLDEGQMETLVKELTARYPDAQWFDYADFTGWDTKGQIRGTSVERNGTIKSADHDASLVDTINEANDPFYMRPALIAIDDKGKMCVADGWKSFSPPLGAYPTLGAKRFYGVLSEAPKSLSAVAWSLHLGAARNQDRPDVMTPAVKRSAAIRMLDARFSAIQVAKDLGVQRQSVYNWQTEDRITRILITHGVSAEEIAKRSGNRLRAVGAVIEATPTYPDYASLSAESKADDHTKRVAAAILLFLSALSDAAVLKETKGHLDEPTWAEKHSTMVHDITDATDTKNAGTPQNNSEVNKPSVTTQGAGNVTPSPMTNDAQRNAEILTDPMLTISRHILSVLHGEEVTVADVLPDLKRVHFTSDSLQPLMKTLKVWSDALDKANAETAKEEAEKDIAKEDAKV